MEPERLSRKARAIFENPDSALFVSPASLWEISIKARKKLMPIDDVNTWWTRYVTGLNPLDRILIAQAKSEGVPILTSDAMIRHYDVNVVW